MEKEAERIPRRALGRGLSALLPPKPAPAEPTSEPVPSGRSDVPEHFEQFQSIPLDQIERNTEQPRDSFDLEKLEELAQSIRANGLIQPITVRKLGPGKYTLIAGERRWRAARMAGLPEIPALVRSAENEQLLELALIENLQREDLNPIETAAAFQRLMAEHGLTHEQIAERTGKDRSTVTNFLRLLKLSPFVRNALASGNITFGHARALLNISDADAQLAACDRLIRDGLSVRQTERYVKQLTETPPGRPEKQSEPTTSDPNIKAALDEMARALGTRVRMVAKSETSGRLEIEYYSQDDLDRIYSVIVKQ
ncbi:MAG: ParB/RepB/Spo0J family partition protein [Acidobacteriaceae bacterium]|nr:ParB/RepB/Spo0J family partition protein [Acidobacteriaceae bacterium]MBV9296115.1 ParB/RepB/Spo0J family partition protein [Acidobacteriaceae bacterium]MBV9765479.1 ParB/RepB/Spo0J family partition protein [Acidobacteriaceae bacterium]